MISSYFVSYLISSRTCLFLFSGVKPLTRNEIKRDISLIESFYDSDNSDASVSSSEAIPSTYPVKPRNFTKLQKRDDALLLQARDVPHSHIHVGGGMSVDDTIEFMKAVETARPDIYAGEKERENLEIRYQVICANVIVSICH